MLERKILKLTEQKEFLLRDVEKISELKKKLEIDIGFLEVRMGDLQNALSKLLDEYITRTKLENDRYLLFQKLLLEKIKQFLSKKSEIEGVVKGAMDDCDKKITQTNMLVLGGKHEYSTQQTMNNNLKGGVDALSNEMMFLKQENKKLLKKNNNLKLNNNKLEESIKEIVAREDSLDRREVKILELAQETQDKYQQLLKKICQQEHPGM